METPSRSWLFFSYSVPKDPSTVRVALWRRLRDLGALYIGSSVCVIPETPDAARRLQAFKKYAEDAGGNARLFSMLLTDDETQRELEAQFQDLRAAEYAELWDRALALLDELRREGESGKFTFAELEENEDELEKLERWLRRIEARDILQCPEHEPSIELLAQCRAALAEFRATTIRREVDLGEEAPGISASDFYAANGRSGPTSS